MHNDKTLIERRRIEWIEAVNAKSVDQYLELLTEDVVWIPPGQGAISGKTAFEAWVTPFFNRYDYLFELIDPVVPHPVATFFEYYQLPFAAVEAVKHEYH